MRPGNWIACLLLAVVAGLAAVFLGVDVRHTAAITAAAFMAGAANVLLEALSGMNAGFEPAAIKPERGLGDIQALAFSLSVNKGLAGNRAQLQLRRTARGALSLYGLAPDDAGPALAALLSPEYEGQDMPRPVFLTAIAELEQLLHEPAALSAHSSKGQTAP